MGVDDQDDRSHMEIVLVAHRSTLHRPRTVDDFASQTRSGRGAGGVLRSLSPGISDNGSMLCSARRRGLT